MDSFPFPDETLGEDAKSFPHQQVRLFARREQRDGRLWLNNKWLHRLSGVHRRLSSGAPSSAPRQLELQEEWTLDEEANET